MTHKDQEYGLKANSDQCWQCDPHRTRMTEIIGNSRPARPQSDAQTDFEPRDCGGFDPTTPTENGGNDRVRDAGLDRDGTQTPTVDSALKVEGNLSHDLSGGFGAALNRPVGTALTGSVALRSDHVDTLSDSPSNNLNVDFSAESTLRSTPFTGRNYDHQQIAADVSRHIDRYTPKIPLEFWELIEVFVRAAVNDAQPTRIDTAKNWLNAVAYLVAWCVQTACLEITREVVFATETIDRYVNEADIPIGHSRGTTRSRLYDVADRLVGPQERSGEYERYPRSATPAPYSRKEKSQLRSLMVSQSTNYRRRNLGVLYGLGAGAGLSAGEMLSVLRDDVSSTPSGLTVVVSGTRARVVPVVAEWEDVLEEALGVMPADELLLLPTRTNPAGYHALSCFVNRCRSTSVHPNSQRLRSTWLVAHLNAGTPLPLLVRAAGLTSMSMFDKYLQFVDVGKHDLDSNILRLGGAK